MAAINNVVIGFDVKNSQVKLMCAASTALLRPQLDMIPFDLKLAETADYVSILENVFADYQKMGDLQQANVTLLLPDNFVAMDFITIPVMKKQKMAEALRIEFNGLYKNNADLQWISYITNANKRNATYQLAITDRTQLGAMQKALSIAKVPAKVTTFSAVGELNSILQLRQKIRRNNFIFADIKENQTNFVICGREHVMGYFSLPFGYDVLSRTEVISESVLYDHDMAELAVINATEMAKKKKLTIDSDELEAQEAEARAQAEADEKARAEAEAEERKRSLEREDLTDEERQRIEAVERAAQEMQKVDEEEAAAREAAQKAEEEEFYEDDDGVAAAAAQKKGGKVFAKRVPKRLPMFMQRPEPDGEEAHIMENFRIFEKHILLCKRQCEYDTMIPNIDFAVINMPQEYEFAINALNQDPTNANCEFRYFAPQTEANPIITDNLEMFGALFANTYNKNLNF